MRFHAITQLLLFFAAGLCLTACPAAAQVATYLTVDEALELAFPKADKIEERFALAGDSTLALIEAKAGRPELQPILRYWRAIEGGQTVGLAAVDEVIGKHQPITYFVAVDESLRVQRVEILVYRESHGGQVAEETFRKQFSGKDVNDPLRLGTDIVTIARATLSCRSITDGVRKLVAYFTYLAAMEEGFGAVPATELNRYVQADNDTATLLRRRQYLMGTVLDVMLYTPDRETAISGTQAVFDEVGRLESLVSSWRPGSEVSRLNRNAGSGEWLELSPETYELLSEARELAEKTEGVFDPTVGPIVKLWRQARNANRTPLEHEIDEALQRVGMQNLELDPNRNAARLTIKGMSLDLGGIGKGWALDRAATLLKNRNLSYACLNFGGNVLALEPPPGMDGWQVQVASPSADVSFPDRLLLINRSVAVSGDAERGILIDGRRFSHIVNPRTGMPAAGLITALVIAISAAEADAFSTTLLALGQDGAVRLAERLALSAWIVPEHDEYIMTPALRELLPVRLSAGEN